MAYVKTGPAPFGFRRGEFQLELQHEEAETRREVFELFADLQSQTEVANLLNAKGCRSRSGALFSAQSIGRILKDPIVLGCEGVPQIVCPSLWQRCQILLAERRKGGPAPRKTRHLFAGILRCLCNQKMYVPSSNPSKYVCRNCSAKISATDLESIFVEYCENAFEDSKIINILFEWSLQDFKTKREIVETLCEHIVLNGKTVTISLSDI